MVQGLIIIKKEAWTWPGIISFVVCIPAPLKWSQIVTRTIAFWVYINAAKLSFSLSFIKTYGSDAQTVNTSASFRVQTTVSSKSSSTQWWHTVVSLNIFLTYSSTCVSTHLLGDAFKLFERNSITVSDITKRSSTSDLICSHHYTNLDTANCRISNQMICNTFFVSLMFSSWCTWRTIVWTKIWYPLFLLKNVFVRQKYSDILIHFLRHLQHVNCTTHPNVFKTITLLQEKESTLHTPQLMLAHTARYWRHKSLVCVWVHMILRLIILSCFAILLVHICCQLWGIRNIFFPSKTFDQFVCRIKKDDGKIDPHSSPQYLYSTKWPDICCTLGTVQKEDYRSAITTCFMMFQYQYTTCVSETVNVFTNLV